MTCERARELIEALHDGELDAVQSAEVREHLASCAACDALYREMIELSASIKEAEYYRAPDALRTRVQRSLKPGIAQISPWWIGAVAALLIAAIGVTYQVAQTKLRDAVVEAHVRSLIGSHLYDVASTDQHTVKPWFQGKLDFSPDVQDFATQGYPLQGGRVEYLDGWRVAALVYKRREHVINVFEWPSPGIGSERSSWRGYNVVRISRKGLACWIVSDLNAEELQQFAKLFS